MRNRFGIGMLVFIFSIGLYSNVFAGQWKSDRHGWWYDNGNGSYPAGMWQWIDGNQDGIAECYYFNTSGYCLINTTTPDKYFVNENGAWTTNGRVETKTIGNNTKQGAVRLVSKPVLMKKLVWYESSAKTKVEGQHWTDVIQMSSSTVNTMVAYETGGMYKTFTAKAAPEDSWNDNDISRIIIYGDGDAVLYESPDITKNTTAFDINVNISGMKAFSIKAVSLEGGGNILLKDAIIQ